MDYPKSSFFARGGIKCVEIKKKSAMKGISNILWSRMRRFKKINPPQRKSEGLVDKNSGFF